MVTAVQMGREGLRGLCQAPDPYLDCHIYFARVFSFLSNVFLQTFMDMVLKILRKGNWDKNNILTGTQMLSVQ